MAIPWKWRPHSGTILTVLCMSACSPASETATDNGAAYPKPVTTIPPGQPTEHGDGPFGLNLSAKLDDLPISQETRESDSDLYVLEAVPQPSKAFATYAVVAYPEVGVCEIRAISEQIVNDAVGSDIRGRIDSLAEALESKYGRAEKIDACSGYTCNMSNWQYDLGTNERAYAYRWDRPQGASSQIRSIYLGAVGSNIITSSIRLDYEVNDAAACKKASNSAKSSNL